MTIGDTTICNRPEQDPDREAKKPAAHETPGDDPPSEDQFGGGDICSPEAEPSTEDDKPLD